MVIIRSEYDGWVPGGLYWSLEKGTVGYVQWVESLGGGVYIENGRTIVKFENTEDALAFKLKYVI
jgi:hypothetical protein